MKKQHGTSEEWSNIAKNYLNTPKEKITKSELQSALIGVRRDNPELALKLQKRIEDKEYATAGQVKKMVLGKVKEFILKEMVCEKLLLKRSDDKIYVVPDDIKNRGETFKNKEKLKTVGFTWDTKVNAWGISKDKLSQAQELVNKINNDPIAKLLDKVDDLPEFIQDADDFSKKTELSKKAEAYINRLSGEVDDVKASEEFKNYIAFSVRLKGEGIKGAVNRMLAYIQNPNATYVMSETRWGKMHRRIKKESYGKKAIWLYRPFGSISKKNVTGDDFDDSGLTDDVKQHRVTRWTVYKAYDVADTEAIDSKGEIPQTPTWHGNDAPEEKADKLSEYASQFAKEHAINVTRDASKGDEKGWASKDHINIQSGIAGAGALGTLVHEIAHSLMHFKETSPFYIQSDKPLTSAEKELQAETVSYIVLKNYDLPCQHHSAYLAIWRANKEAFQKSMEDIKNVSNYIIEGIDKIAKEKESSLNTSLKEMINNGNIGITEMNDFYNIASPKEVAIVERLLELGYEKQAWKFVIKKLREKNMLNEFNWKSAIAGGLLGLSTLKGMAAPHQLVKKDANTNSIVQKVSTQSAEDLIKKYENDKNYIKGGFNKKDNKWYPHKSYEGGSDTIAYGHKILKGEKFSKGITDSEAIALLKKDISNKESLAQRKIIGYNNFPQYVKNAIINALYRGDIGPKTISLINAGKWNDVSSEYLNHTNYKSGKSDQIKARMKHNADAFDKYAIELKK